MAKIGRNALCPCGSGRKFTKCHGDLRGQQIDVLPASAVPPSIISALREKSRNENLRIKQQGLGRPIISGEIGEYKVVATGSSVQYSKNWKTFADFLSDYLKLTTGGEWGNAEISKPLNDRHPILQWYESYCEYQAASQPKKGEIFSAIMTGVVHCYLGLAYNLYLLKHNVELQERLVARLKDIKQFQGAYYELLVANCLIRAGFTLELENEVDQTVKHCEFSARSRTTGMRYWVEAKMRSVPSILGKTHMDGSTSNDPTSKLTHHLSEALKKPAPDRRMIFIDLNGQPNEGSENLSWLEQAVRRLDDRERDLEEGQEAYVLVTNMAFHRALNSSTPQREVLAYGLGISDFSKPGPTRLPVWYRAKQKHIDAHTVIEAFRSYPQIPDTFDGRPASEAYLGTETRRIQVGETYFFEDVGDNGEIGTVSSVSVLSNKKQAYVAVSTEDDRSNILTFDLTDEEYEDYTKYGDAYFGEPDDKHGECKDVFELFEWLVGGYSNTPRERLLEIAKDHPNLEHLRTLDQSDLVLEICESWAMTLESDRIKNEQSGKSK